MIRKTILLLLFGFLIVYSQGQGTLVPQSSNKNKEFFYDASKEKLLGNYEKAIELFKKCLEIDPGDDAAMFELANIYHDQDKLDEAAEMAEKAVATDPSNKWYQTLLVQIYQEKSEFQKSEAVLQDMIARNPENIELYQDLALNYLYQGDYKEAIQIYDDIEQKIGVTEAVSLQKQKLYLLSGKPDKAIYEMVRLSETNPNDTRYLEMLAELYMSNKEYDKALVIYEEIQKLDPSNPYINISLSDYYRKQGDNEKALEYLRTGFSNPNLDIDSKINILLAYYTVNEIYNDRKKESFELSEILIKTHPDDPKAWSIYADLLYQDDQYENARTAFRKVISIDSSRYLVWEQLLFVESQLQDFLSMKDESARALNLFPQQPMLYLFSGIANYQLKDYPKAIDDLEMGKNFVVGNNKMLAQFYSSIGDCYFQLKEMNKAYDAYDAVLKIDPENSIVLNNYAYYLSLEGKELERAEMMAKKAIELDPENGANQDTYGWVLYKQGKYQEAKEWIGKAIENREGSAVVIEHYGDVLWKLGDKEGAVKYWERAATIGEGSEFLEKKIKEKKLFE